MISVSDLADELNDQARSLAPELLPNGYKSGNYWMASGIDDTGAGQSLAVALSGARIGHWCDYGNARAGEERGDMLDLAALKLFGGDKKRAVEWAKHRLGKEDDFRPGQSFQPNREEMEARARAARERAAAREKQDADERELKARRAKALFLHAGPLEGTPADLYLRGRAIEPGEKGWPGSLRYEPECWCKPLRCKVPTMLAAIYDAQGRQIGTHRTFLELDRAKGWRKAGLLNPKMVLGNMWGGFIPIHKGASTKSMRDMAEGEQIYVTEGIEDALTVRMHMPHVRIICAISLGNMGAILLPERARQLVIVADRDTNPTAQDTLERSIAQQQARGLTVSIVMPPAELGGVRIKDVNDWHRALTAQATRKGAA